MKNVIRWATVAFATVAMWSFAQDASAQGRGRGFGGPFALVRAEPIQEELKLDASQKEKVSALAQAFDEEGQKKRDDAKIPGFMELFQLPQEEQDKARKKMEEINVELVKNYRPKLDEILSDDQTKRLDQIVLQVAGAAALTDPTNVEKLKITDDQAKKIAAVIEEYNKGIQEMRESGNFDFAKMTELGDTRNKNAVAVLDDEQKKAYEEMRGAPFDISKLFQAGFGGKGKGGKGKGGKGKGGAKA